MTMRREKVSTMFRMQTTCRSQRPFQGIIPVIVVKVYDRFFGVPFSSRDHLNFYGVFRKIKDRNGARNERCEDDNDRQGEKYSLN